MIAGDIHSAQECEEAELLAAGFAAFMGDNPSIVQMTKMLSPSAAAAFVSLLEVAWLAGLQFKLNDYHMKRIQ